ncbi:uncharacterized protein KD926_006279 [Aspergillus affinis]|uniref:uncharacterized protein n=1 Tax=Aspergillus affinis TaxID=1070780 RepID=UPI0022FE36B9|nr:uncharacterized protein KD926_006279 [Aspergillus affinis]KAI9041942.1 hypothetical protein KD926_006279 [Aspergillus affinis]
MSTLQEWHNGLLSPMLFMKASILTLSLFSGLSSAHYSTQPSSTNGLQLIGDQRLPDQRYANNLVDSEACPFPSALELVDETATNTMTELDTRTPIEVCESDPSRLSRFASFTTAVYTFTASHTGNVDGWRYEYHPTGRNCDTTAQQKAIPGAIYDYLKTVEGDKIYDTQCLLLDYGGPYAGYLKLGKEGAFDSSAYCGPTLHFEYCASEV